MQRAGEPEKVSKKTDTATFRIDKDILENLRNSAEDEKITLNALVNQILSQFIEWHSPAKKAGMVPLPKVLLMKIMDKLTSEEIVQISEYMVTNEIKDIILILKKEHTVSSFMSAVESWAKSSNFPFIHEEQGGGAHKYVVSHEMGKNWSLYFGIIFTRIFEELGVSHVNFEITDKTLVFSFTFPN